eukprot:422237-Prymnesium_polylepis.1
MPWRGEAADGAGAACCAVVASPQASAHVACRAPPQAGNERQYGTATPPAFNLTRASSVPLALFIGADDDLVAPTDVALMRSQARMAGARGGRLQAHDHASEPGARAPHTRAVRTSARAELACASLLSS